MNNSTNFTHPLISNFFPPSYIAADLEILCQGLEDIFDSQPVETTVFSNGLTRILEWAKIRPLVEDSSATTGWRAQFAGLPKLGGTLTCQNDVWELMLSFDANQTAYMGSWRSIRSGEEDHGGLFSIENADSGQVFVLDTGYAKQRVSLANTEKIAWGRLDAFLQNIQNQESMQPYSSVNTPTSVSSPSAEPDEERSPHAAPTILGRPARQPLEEAGKKHVPDEQAAMIESNRWKCACGSDNTGQFCPNCGKEKPTQAQPVICKKCGGELSNGARFCRHCGAGV